MNLLKFGFVLIALKAFAVPGGNSSVVDEWRVCNVEKNGPTIILENACKRLLLCYKSKFLTGQNSKVGRRFRSKIGMNGTGLFAECAKVMGREGWHALIIGKMSDGKIAFESSLCFGGFFGNQFINETAKNTAIQIFSNANGLLEKDLQTGLHLGAFMDDFDGMSLRVLALDLVLFTKQNGTEWCKKKCFSLSYGLDPTPFNTPDAQNAVTEQSRLTTAYSRLLTGTPTSKLKPTASNKDHFGTSCTEIIFPTDVPKFMLNISASPYQIGCADYEKHYAMNETPPPEYYSGSEHFVDACMKVPTQKCKKHIGVHVCYKSSRKGPGNSSIAELCRKHLGVDSNFAGFAVQICVHREEQMLVVESFVNLSFSNKTFKRLRNFSFSLDEISSAMETIPILFIEFGNGHHQSAIRNESGKEIVSDFKWNNENDGIGAVLNDIAPEKINESWAKKLHFVPPSTDRMRVFFQIANPEFSKLITNRTKVKPYENNPNKTNPTLCDEYGDDCEPIRELLHKIENLSKCNQPKGGPIETPDSSPFKVPSWVDKPPIGHPPKASITLLCDGDLFCNKDELQKQYDEKRRSCGLKPEADGRRQKRQYRLSNATIGKWTEFPILIGFLKQNLPPNYNAWDKAIRTGADLIMKETCIRFEFLKEISKNKEGIGIRDVDLFTKFTSPCTFGYTVSTGKKGGWQDLALAMENHCPIQRNMSVVAAHELLHVLGLLHEQSRSDARNFTIMEPSGSKDKQNEANIGTQNFDFDYDFGSVMHYDAGYDNETDKYGLITLPRFYQETIGQRERISFKDAAIINNIYCNDSCKGHNNLCLNGGYLNPNDCLKCLCPDGYGMPNCESLEPNLNCVDTTGTSRELEADGTNRVLKPKIQCDGSGAPCRCFWRIKPKFVKKLKIQLTFLNESFVCSNPCTSSYVEIKYRSDKRAQGAKLCCPRALRVSVPNAYTNWIEAKNPDTDIIISTHISTNQTAPTTWFELNYEAGYVTLTDSCDCVHPENLYIEKRNPRTNLTCVSKKPEDCFCHGNTECLSEKKSCHVGWRCPVFVVNGQIRKIMPLKDFNARPYIWGAILYCFRADGASKSFWGYRENATMDPIRVDEVQCLAYEAAGVKPEFTSLDDAHQFNESAQTINVTIWRKTKDG